mgnify:CR=1 FL=1|tara:strand:- start:313 stop:798 length:486 start_codon:yes stop_codon:yes gene_type:complete
MKFAALIGTTSAITLFNTRGQMIYQDNELVQTGDWAPGQTGTMGSGEYERVIPARFSSDSDDVFMRSMIKSYATEKNLAAKDAPPVPSGKFVMNETNMKAASREVLCQHKGLCGAKLDQYLGTYFSKAWGHYDVNRTGEVAVETTPLFMRFLASDQYMSLQ